MKEEEEEKTSEPTPEDLRQGILDKYRGMIEADKKAMSEFGQQGELSKAYTSTCSFTK
jgi:hypothetical protein